MTSYKRYFAVALYMLCFSANVIAVSITGRTTDDSVCDLSPSTSARLEGRTFVEDGTRNADQIYTRIALRFITQNCRNNQTLILDSRFGDDFDMRYFRNVSHQLCAIADVQRIANGTAENPNAFQVKCRIMKLEEATKWLKEAEATKATETLISEGAPIKSGESARRSNDNSSPSRGDCSKLSYASIFVGGGACR